MYILYDCDMYFIGGAGPSVQSTIEQVPPRPSSNGAPNAAMNMWMFVSHFM